MTLRTPFVALLLALTAPLTGCLTQGADLAALPLAEAQVYNATVTSFDRTPIAVTVFRPAGATEESPVPVILWSHGWSGTRIASLTGRAKAYVDAGYAVVSVDARGHGESGGLATIHHRDTEVRDFRAVLDWVHDTLPWVQRQPNTGIPKDILAGASGASYGGAYQLTTASHDRRLDALVPEITWNDLRYSLTPNGGVKTAWVTALHAMGSANARMDPRIGEWYREAMLTNRLPQEALAHFEGSNPEPANITAPTLLVQGVPDQLFNLNEAVATYQALRAAGTEVRLFTHLTGHIVPEAQPIGLDAGERHTSPCGDVTNLSLAWFDHHLRGTPMGPTHPAPITLALESGECLALQDPQWPPPGEALNVTIPASPAPQAGGTLLIPLLAPVTESTVVAGIPRVNATLTGPPEALLFLSLVAQTKGGMHVVDDQSTAVRVHVPLGATSVSFEVDLAGVATRLEEGDRLFLRIDGLNEWFAANGNRVPGAAVLRDVKVTVPTVTPMA